MICNYYLTNNYFLKACKYKLLTINAQGSK